MRAASSVLLMLALSCKPVHGNGKVEGSEQCDDGNALDGDGCNVSCELEVCGDGLINNGNLEQCDDGNTENDDGCSSVCKRERCGDGVVNNLKEQCDDDNVDNNDGCNSRCQFEFCGDGIVNNKTEACDDGQRVDSGCLDCQVQSKRTGSWDFLPREQVSFKAPLIGGWLALKDINKDKILDLITLDYTGIVSVAPGQGDGTFRSDNSLYYYKAASSPVAALGDVNGDGLSDLVAYDVYGKEVYFYPGNNTFHFDAPATLSLKKDVQALAVADLNNDGKDDVLIALDDELRLWRGSGTGLKKSTKISDDFMKSLALADFNGDSWLDIAALGSEVKFFLGSKSGSFEKQETFLSGKRAHSLIAGDINNDGVTDLMVAGEILLTFSYMKGAFVAEKGPSLPKRINDPNPLGACDFNNDGYLDLAFAEEKTLHVFFNSKRGTFEDKYHSPTKTVWRPMLTTGDLNKDGECDIITNEFQPTIWLGNGESKKATP